MHLSPSRTREFEIAASLPERNRQNLPRPNFVDFPHVACGPAFCRTLTWYIGTAPGHLALGFEITILGMSGRLGLAGISVDKSIILVRTID